MAAAFPRVSSDGKTQTIKLMRTYRFDNGARVTAANYVAAFNRDANPNLQSPAAGVGYLNEIVGAYAVMAGKAQTISGVRALGPYTLQIRTTKPVPDLLSRLTMPFFCPIAVNTPPKEIDDPLGSGPYYVASRVPNRQVVLERNRFYRGRGPANVDQIVCTVGPGQEACRQAVEQDELDWCEFLSDAGYREIAAKYGINRPNGRFFFNPTLATGYFAFNHDRPAFKGRGQIPLMKAINWAIDRPALVRASGYLGGKRTDQILPPAMGREAGIYPTRRRRRAEPREGAGAARQGEVQAEDARPLHGNVSVLLRRLGPDLPVQHEAARDRRRDQVLRQWLCHVCRSRIRGAPFDVVTARWSVDYADPSTYFDPLLDGNNLTPTGNTNFAYFDRPEVQPGNRAHRPPTRPGPTQGLGRSRRGDDARRPAVGAVPERSQGGLRLEELRLLRPPTGHRTPRRRRRVQAVAAGPGNYPPPAGRGVAQSVRMGATTVQPNASTGNDTKRHENRVRTSSGGTRRHRSTQNDTNGHERPSTWSRTRF